MGGVGRGGVGCDGWVGVVGGVAVGVRGVGVVKQS